MNRTLSIFVLLCAAISGRPSPAQDPSYAKHVRPFLAKYCFECHNAKSAKGGLELESYKAILEGGNRGEVMVPGKPDASRLVTMTEGKAKPAMPPKAARFHPKADEVAVLRHWVKAGAKDDSALIKVDIPDIKPRKATMAPVTALAFQPMGNTLAVGRHKALELVDLRNEVVTRQSQPHAVTALAFNATGTELAIALGDPGDSSLVILRGMKDAVPPVEAFKALHKDAILDIAFSPDARHLVTSGYDTLIKLIPLHPQSAVAPTIRPLKEHSDSVYAVGFNRDGTLLASCGADRAVKMWQVESGKLLYTLGESTDWLYTLAWRPDGKRLASGGVDKSIRIYDVGPGGAKILHSVFAHEAPVQKLIYSRDGATLYSLGQDGFLKAWDAEKMVERKVYDRFPETPLALAVRDDLLAVGLYGGVVQLLDPTTGKVKRRLLPSPLGVGVKETPAVLTSLSAATAQPKTSGKKESKKAPVKPPIKEQLTAAPDPFPAVKAAEGNDSPGSGQLVKPPVSIAGKLDKAGDVDYFRIDAKKGQPLGIQAIKEGQSKLEVVLQLTDVHGKVLAESTDGVLGIVFPADGTYALGIRDREFKGGADMTYKLHVGMLPVVISVFPLGVERGQETEVRVKGVFLDEEGGVGRPAPSAEGTIVKVKVPADAAPGSKIKLPLKSRFGQPLGLREVVVGEFPEVIEKPGDKTSFVAGALPTPGTANGYLNQPNQADVWKFRGKKGEKLVIEAEARRLGSALDSIIEVLDARGDPVPRAVLRCQAKTFVTFRDHDSAQANIRIEAWSELAVNDYLFVGGELMKIVALPTHPDADCNFFSANGQRTGFLDTTPTHHSLNEPMYKVSIHPPGSTFPPNGYPVFTLFYRNDDGGPGFGRDSRLIFECPADGDYQVRITDSRGQAGDNFGYRLTVRPPRPSFNIRFSPSNPTISKGGAIPITVNADRLDGYDGPIHLQFTDLPPGFSAPPTYIEAGQASTALALYADENAPGLKSPASLKLSGHALINGTKHLKQATPGTVNLAEPGEIVCWTEQEELAIKPGAQAKLTVYIERRHGFLGRVPLDVKGLPHGVRVLDLGLNGILINEKEARRTIAIYAEPWVEASSHPFVVFAKREGKNTEHGAKSILLKVGAK